jgi:hypothetical protein
MKQNIIMVIILIALFIFGLLIYDFSDELDSKITSHNWYIYENKEMDVMSFKNNEFSYTNADTKKSVVAFESCVTYRYNKSINVIKLNCSILGNKIYIKSYDDEHLILTINNEEITLYKSRELAEAAKFKNDNNLTDSEYNILMNKDLTKYKSVTTDEIVKLNKSKDINYVAFINGNLNYDDTFNYEALDSIINKNSDKIIYVYNTKDINESDISKLHQVSDLFTLKLSDYVSNNIKIYRITKKSIIFLDEINVTNYAEASSYNIKDKVE